MEQKFIKKKIHNFIFKKHSEDKWSGCEYINKLDDLEDEDEKDDYNIINNNSNKNNLNYIHINISLTHFLMNCLPIFKYDGTFQIKIDAEGNSNAPENNNQNNIQHNEEEHNDINNLYLENNMKSPVNNISKMCNMKFSF